MNTVNLPLALFTVILRRFIDKFRTAQGAVILKSSIPFLLDTSVLKPCMYVYMFCTGLYYTIKHIQRGTIVSLAKKCTSVSAETFRDRCERKGRKSTVMKNLMRGREGQQKALRYVASMTPQDTILVPSSHVMQAHGNETANFSTQTMRPEISYGSNPYYEPRDFSNNINRGNPARQIDFYRRHNIQRPSVNAITNDNLSKAKVNVSISDSANSNHFKRNKIDSSESKELLSPELSNGTDNRNNVEDMGTSDTKKKTKQRSCLTLRGRKIAKNNLNYTNRIVRKTRSGRVYGYQAGGPYYYKRRKT